MNYLANEQSIKMLLEIFPTIRKLNIWSIIIGLIKANI